MVNDGNLFPSGEDFTQRMRLPASGSISPSSASMEGVKLHGIFRWRKSSQPEIATGFIHQWLESSVSEWIVTEQNRGILSHLKEMQRPNLRVELGSQRCSRECICKSSVIFRAQVGTQVLSCFCTQTKNSSWYFDVLGRSLSCFVSIVVVFILEYLITSHIYPKLNLLLLVHPSTPNHPNLPVHHVAVVFGWRFSQHRDSRSQSARKIAGRLVKIFCKLWPKSCINRPFESLQKKWWKCFQLFWGVGNHLKIFWTKYPKNHQTSNISFSRFCICNLKVFQQSRNQVLGCAKFT